jgi:hypothetical protein
MPPEARPPSLLQHPRQHLIRWAVAVGEGLDIHDHPFAHLDPPSSVADPICGSKHNIGQLAQSRVNHMPALEHIQPGPPNSPARKARVSAFSSITSPREVFTITASASSASTAAH